VRFAYGCRRYIFTATDHASRFAFAVAVPRANSANAARFAGLVQSVFPAPIQQVLTDNGSEFAGTFDDFAREQGWRHCHTYPKCPKMNAYNERFNRTVQEELVDFEEDLPADDLRGFNRHLLDWLDRYNGERPHWGLNYLTPCQAIAASVDAKRPPKPAENKGFDMTTDMSKRSSDQHIRVGKAENVISIKASLMAEIYKEKPGMYVSYCAALDLYSQGATAKEAEKNIIEATEAFIESCVERDTLNAVLKECGFRPVDAKPPRKKTARKPATSAVAHKQIHFPAELPMMVA